MRSKIHHIDKRFGQKKLLHGFYIPGTKTFTDHISIRYIAAQLPMLLWLTSVAARNFYCLENAFILARYEPFRPYTLLFCRTGMCV